MINILNSICNEIIKIYPQSPIQIQSLKKDFERPSFFVQFVAGDTEIFSGELTRCNYTFQIIGFAEVDEFGVVDPEKQLVMSEKLRKVFSKGYFKLVDSDRVIKIAGLRSGQADGEASLDLDVYIINNNSEIEPEPIPPMSDFDFKLILN